MDEKQKVIDLANKSISVTDIRRATGIGIMEIKEITDKYYHINKRRNEKPTGIKSSIK
jgi:hypothetical protein